MEIVFLFYDGMTALDAIGPHEILSRLPGAHVRRVAVRPGPVCADSAGLQLVAEEALSDVTSADVLVLPGGGNAEILPEGESILDWVRSVHETTRWTVSICTGSLILGAAGLLSGKVATTHWALLEHLRLWGAEPVSRRIVESGKIMMAAGVSAGIDMALALAAKISGVQVAHSLQLGIEYDPDPPFDVGSPEKADPKIREALLARLGALFEGVKKVE